MYPAPTCSFESCPPQTSFRPLLHSIPEAEAVAQLVREYKLAKNLRKHLRIRLDLAVEEALVALQGFENAGLERRLRELKRLVHARRPVFLVTRANE